MMMHDHMMGPFWGIVAVVGIGGSVGLDEGQRDRGGRRVAVAVDVHDRLVHREPQALVDGLDDADVGLVGDEQVDVGHRLARLLEGQPG